MNSDGDQQSVASQAWEHPEQQSHFARDPEIGAVACFASAEFDDFECSNAASLQGFDETAIGRENSGRQGKILDCFHRKKCKDDPHDVDSHVENKKKMR